MNAKQYAHIDRQKDAQAQQRTSLSAQHSDQGFSYLAQALDASSPGEKKPLMLQACDAFAKGIRYQRSNPEPYIGFAYVLMLIGNTDKALAYIKEAQRLDPEHDDVVLILAEIKHLKSLEAAKSRTPAQTSQPRSNRAPAPAEAPAEIDYDALYDKLELAIMTEVKSLISAPLVEAKAAVEAGHLADLARQINAIKMQLTSFERQLEIIDKEIDIVDLSLKLKPIEAMLRRYQMAQQASETLIRLCREISEQYRLVHQILQETRLSTDPDDVAIVEENLEVFLDQTDGFANGLDQLEAQGYEIEAGLNVYNRLLAVLEDLQDALDDLKSQFGQP